MTKFNQLGGSDMSNTINLRAKPCRDRNRNTGYTDAQPAPVSRTGQHRLWTKGG